MFARALRAKRLLECVSIACHQHISHTNVKLTSSLRFRKMEGLQGMRGAEGGSDMEFHDIPNNLLTNTNTIRSDTPVSGTMERAELPILLRILQEDGRPLPIGSFTERSVVRKVQNLTGITLDQVTMVTPSDAVLEYSAGCPVVCIAQELDAMKEWEDIPIYVSCLMGNRHYIMEVCHDRANYESKKRELELETEKLCEEQSEHCELQRGSDPRILLLRGVPLVVQGLYPGSLVIYTLQ